MRIVCHSDFKFSGHAFEILIFENRSGKYETYEAWLRGKDYGIMELMFGCDKAQVDLEVFQKLVEFNVLTYAESYIYDYILEGEEE